MATANKTGGQRNKIRTQVLIGTAIGTLAASAALAQPAAPRDGEASLEEIVVTGSRIKRAGVDTIYPAVTVSSEVLESRAYSNIADALNELPQFGNPTQTSAGNQANGLIGQNYVDFLGLGSQRTLTLINGRRFVSSNPPGGPGAGSGLQVDLNVIPTALIERIETIGIGGAPIYGSDAVAGTVNLIMKQNYQGMDVTGQYGVTQKGDGDETRVQFVAGGNFGDDRGNVTLAAEYTKNQGLLLKERPLYTKNDPWYAQDNLITGDRRFKIFYNQQIDTFHPGGIVSPGTAVRASLGTGALANGQIYYFAPDGTLQIFNRGGRAPDTATAVWAQGGDGYDLLDESSQILSPTERMVFSGSARFAFTDNLEFFSDFQAANTKAKELANQDGFQAGTGPGGEYGPLRFTLDNPFLSSQARGILQANGLTSFYLHRYHTDVYNTQWENESFLWRISTGLNGKLGERFNWEASFVHGENDVDPGGTMIIDGRFLNAIDAIRLTAADIASVPAGRSILTFSGTKTANVGDIVCRAALQAAQGTLTGLSGNGVTDRHQPYVTGCVPLNLFGAGAPSREAIDWVTGPEGQSSSIEQTVYNFNIGGALVDLPAGPLSANVGYEARKESAGYVPSVALEIALGRHEPIKPTSGSFDTSEFFGETLIPLVSRDMGWSFLEFAEASGAYRKIDNSVTGKDDVWTAGGRFSVIPGVVFRGNYTRSVRAPSLGELYAPVVPVFSQASDPCDARFIAQGTANRVANCRAAIPNYNPSTYTSLVVSTSRLGSQGGNPNLQNEKAKAFTLGTTIEPRFIDKLLVTVDYINIKIDDAITALNLTQIMRACYDGVAGNSACGQFRRDAQGEIIDFQTGQTNAQIFDYESMDYRVSYGFDVRDLITTKSDWGSVNLNLNLHQTINRNTSVVGEVPLATVGSYTVPRMSATFDTTWNVDDLRFFWRMQWRPKATIDLTRTRTYLDAGGNVITKTGDYFMHNASVAYSLGDFIEGGPRSTVLQLSVDNIFNDKPNTEELALGYFTLSQQLGRTFTLRLRSSF